MCKTIYMIYVRRYRGESKINCDRVADEGLLPPPRSLKISKDRHPRGDGKGRKGRGERSNATCAR